MPPDLWEISMKYRIAVLGVVGFVLAGCGETPAPSSTSPGDAAMDLDATSEAGMDASFARDQSFTMDTGGGDGDGCDRNEDCDSGYCVHSPEGDRVCTPRCANDDMCPEGYE